MADILVARADIENALIEKIRKMKPADLAAFTSSLFGVRCQRVYKQKQPFVFKNISVRSLLD